MPAPLLIRKKVVDLASTGDRSSSRIRRDPPPKAEGTLLNQARVRRNESLSVAFGISAFALALVTILIGVTNWLH